MDDKALEKQQIKVTSDPTLAKIEEFWSLWGAFIGASPEAMEPGELIGTGKMNELFSVFYIQHRSDVRTVLIDKLKRQGYR